MFEGGVSLCYQGVDIRVTQDGIFKCIVLELHSIYTDILRYMHTG